MACVAIGTKSYLINFSQSERPVLSTLIRVEVHQKGEPGIDTWPRLQASFAHLDCPDLQYLDDSLSKPWELDTLNSLSVDDGQLSIRI